jgi:putative AlgH/UPF0301 family transcriptional regulator
MFDKLSFGQTPTWYRFFMGTAAWHPQQLEHEIAQGAWMTLPTPGFELITQDSSQMWQSAVDAVSQSMFNSYI